MCSDKTSTSSAMGLHYQAGTWCLVPKGEIYPLSILEQKAMDEYIVEALKQGFI